MVGSRLVGIPRAWLDVLAKKEMIEQALAGLLSGSPLHVAKPKVTSSLMIPQANPPTIRSYWVVEGKFLAGAYPGSPDENKHRQRIQQLWDAGLRTFINLVEEDEANKSRQPFRRYDDVLRELARHDGERVAHLRFPVPDLSVPSIDRMRSILDAVDLAFAANRPVYVHCFGGVGRTGTAVCCWLLRHGLASPANVIQILQDLRQADHQTKQRKAPENNKQIEFVESWVEGLA